MRGLRSMRETMSQNAISIPNGCYAVVDEELCIGCGICEKIVRQA